MGLAPSVLHGEVMYAFASLWSDARGSGHVGYLAVVLVVALASLAAHWSFGSAAQQALAGRAASDRTAMGDVDVGGRSHAGVSEALSTETQGSSSVESKRPHVGAASTGNGAASTGNGAASTGNGAASTGNGAASTGSGTASTGNGAASTGNGAASTGNGAASTGNGAASTGNGAASTGSGAASTGNGAASAGSEGGKGSLINAIVSFFFFKKQIELRNSSLAETNSRSEDDVTARLSRAERADALRYQLQAETFAAKGKDNDGTGLLSSWSGPFSIFSSFGTLLKRAHSATIDAALVSFEEKVQRETDMTLAELRKTPGLSDLMAEIAGVKELLARMAEGGWWSLNDGERKRINDLLSHLNDKQQLRAHIATAVYQAEFARFEQRVKDETGIEFAQVYFKEPFADLLGLNASIREALSEYEQSGELSVRAVRQMARLTRLLRNEGKVNARFAELHAFVEKLIAEQTPPAALETGHPDVGGLSYADSSDLLAGAQEDGVALIGLPHPYARPEQLNPGDARIDRQYAYHLVYQEAKKHGWHTGSNWQDLQRIVWRESWFDNSAANTSSTASGLFQFLDSTWEIVGYGHVMEGRAHGQYGTLAILDPLVQTEAGLTYIEDRYNTPSAAWSYHLRNKHY